MSLTLAIIKPDAVQSGKAGNILAHLEAAGFTVQALQMTRMNTVQAGAFYAVHKERPFFKDLTTYMCTGPIVTLVLARDNAIPEWRKLMGATNPKDADAGTLRKDFAIDIEKNSVHGSDSAENAAYEISYFFSQTEIQD